MRLDVLGRPFKTIERLDESTELRTTLTLDAVGNPLVVTDPREVEIQTQSFDMLGRPITTGSPDGGDVTALLDVAGQPLFVWKSGDLGIETEVDALRRKVRTWQWDTNAETKVLRERTVFGEALLDVGSPSYDPKDDHLRGRLYRIYDTAGMVELSYDFKGNVLTTTRRFFDDDEEDVDWQSFDPVAYPLVGDDKDSVAELHNGDGGSNPGAASLLESEEFTVSATFDAMNRVVTRTSPDGAVTAHEYDDGGRLNLVEVESDTIVADIQHNARGQRSFIEYGNAVTTTTTYEPLTFRLHTLVSSGGRQSLEYSYDPVGNILGIENNADDTLYFDNAAVEPHQSFQYDALYRLTNAWGREKSARGRADWVEPTFGPVPDASETMQGYEQRYLYDLAGNITEMRHLVSATTDWVRTYTYPTTSNRLSTTTEAAGTVSYQHDVRGNIVFWPHLFNDTGSPPNVEVDFRDQMRRAQLDSSNYAVYHYDHSGQRARKVVKRGANIEERRYVAGWEVWRKVVSGTLDEERTTLHVMDDERRVAMIETRTVVDEVEVGTPVPIMRYQLDNHLGTSVLELDESGGIISYEEYHPYGTCAWWAGDSSIDVSRRRYRYTGMERDEETGLQVHGVRYYAPWLGRWGSADPIGLGGGSNQYEYCSSSPAVFGDADGKRPRKPRQSDVPSAPAQPSPDSDSAGVPLTGNPEGATQANKALALGPNYLRLAAELGAGPNTMENLRLAVDGLSAAQMANRVHQLTPDSPAKVKETMREHAAASGLYSPDDDLVILLPEDTKSTAFHEGLHYLETHDNRQPPGSESLSFLDNASSRATQLLGDVLHNMNQEMVGWRVSETITSIDGFTETGVMPDMTDSAIAHRAAVALFANDATYLAKVGPIFALAYADHHNIEYNRGPGVFAEGQRLLLEKPAIGAEFREFWDSGRAAFANGQGWNSGLIPSWLESR